jgi:hypothetical protein
MIKKIQKEEEAGEHLTNRETYPNSSSIFSNSYFSFFYNILYCSSVFESIIIINF